MEDWVVDGFVEISAVLRAGVYLLMHHERVVYVGKAKVMLGRLYKHRVAWGSKKRTPITGAIPAKGMLFDRVLIRPCGSHEVDDLEAALIARYQPRYNIQLKTSVPPEMGDIVAKIVAARGIAVATQTRIDRRGF